MPKKNMCNLCCEKASVHTVQPLGKYQVKYYLFLFIYHILCIHVYVETRTTNTAAAAATHRNNSQAMKKVANETIRDTSCSYL